MDKPQYVKPRVQALNRLMSVAVGGCGAGSKPGTCGLPGYNAGSCNPTGDAVGTAVPCTGGSDPTNQCPAGSGAITGCGAAGYKAMSPRR